MVEKVEFYELKKRSATLSGIVTAAVWGCAICDRAIAGMGGPGSGEICVLCADDITSGRMKKRYYAAEK